MHLDAQPRSRNPFAGAGNEGASSTTFDEIYSPDGTGQSGDLAAQPYEVFCA
jgi:hypothetical protein